MSGTAIAARADFSEIRYGQCWEDADVLLAGLGIRPGDVCLSIASAGDNTLSLLAAGAGRVIALDLSRAQLACLELRVAAYRSLAHAELLELIGSRRSDRRPALYARCREGLGDRARAFWDARPAAIAAGIGGAGKFERYFERFRTWIVPLIHGRARVAELLAGHPDPAARERFYRDRWDTLRWRWLFRLFFSKFVMGRLGRDPEFFAHIEGGIADRVLSRTRHAFTALDPAGNPYLHWIFSGTHGDALPHALRPESFDRIRANLDRLEWHAASLEDWLSANPAVRFDRANLSNIFEYMSRETAEGLLERLAAAANPGARLAYWNLFGIRRRPDRLAARLRPRTDEAEALHRTDRAWFYRAFVIDEVAG